MMLSISISVISVIIGIVIILGLGRGESVTGAFMLLSILGAPLTFLHRIFWIFGERSKIPIFGMYFLYFLQYQILAFSVYKFYNQLNLKIYLAIVSAIIISAAIMYCFQMGKFL